MSPIATWTPVFDGESSYSIGCVTMDPNNPNIIWVGTGENNSQRSVSFGDGAYKSLDGGDTWTNMGLEESEHIGNIVVDPRDSNVVWVSAQGPLWRSGGDRRLYKTTPADKASVMVFRRQVRDLRRSVLGASKFAAEVEQRLVLLRQAPTATHQKAYEWANDAFETVRAELEQLAVDLEALEARAEAAGAPWTPGRVPASDR